MAMPINECKVANMASYFLLKTESGTMSHLKLMKLLYLSDRECFRCHGFSMSGDRMVSMKHGPVLSQTLNLINGFQPSEPDGWDSMISAKENHQVAVRPGVKLEDLGKLSRADKEIMDSVWEKFESVDQWKLVEYTHKNCSEWQDPGDSSAPIEFDTLFNALGFDELQIEALKSQIEEQEAIESFFLKR